MPRHPSNRGMNRLSEGKGNIVRRIEELREIGAKTEKRIPQNYLKSLEDPGKDPDEPF